MAKKIKFNLQVNGVGVSNLDDLQENFNIEDIMEHSKNGLLSRWLEVQGHKDELEKLEKLQKSLGEKSDNFALAKGILNIFDMDKELDKNALKMALDDINYKEYKEKLLKENADLEKNAKALIQENHKKFHDLICEIIESNGDVAKIKSNLKIIEKDYFDLFLLHFSMLITVLKQRAPLALLFALGTEKIRSLILANIKVENSDDNTKHLAILDKNLNDALPQTTKYLNDIGLTPIDYLNYGHLQALFEMVYKILDFGKLDTNVIKDFNGSTDGMWRDLVAKGKRVLVLSLSGTAKASRIPGDGETNEPLGSDELNGKFIILDGLNFQSSDAKALIKYVEL